MENVQAVKQRFGIIGNDPILNRAIEKAIQVAPTDISVLVTGESGVGKESIPKIIHSLSHRKHGKYIAVNCGAIPEGTIDSELFGHEKGSFTGATATRSGYFEVADGGTLFLDEIGNLPPALQAKLLSVLESRHITRVGSTKSQFVDIRLICATNMPVQEMITDGRFRQDLLYRINTVEINLPPLRERPEDIPLLVDHFIRSFSKKYQKKIAGCSAETILKLQDYHWPGNIRELQHTIERAIILSDSDYLQTDDFAFQVQQASAEESQSSRYSLGKAEKKMIMDVLKNCHGNVSQAARTLGISRAALYRRMERHKL